MSVICHFIKAHINAEIFQITKAVTALGALGAKQKVILLECDVFLSYIFVEWTYSGLDCIQAVDCRVRVGNVCHALDYNRSTSLHRWQEYALAAGDRAS